MKIFDFLRFPAQLWKQQLANVSEIQLVALVLVTTSQEYLLGSVLRNVLPSYWQVAHSLPLRAWGMEGWGLTVLLAGMLLYVCFLIPVKLAICDLLWKHARVRFPRLDPCGW